MSRPTGVTVIAVLSFLGACMSVVLAFGFLFGGALVATLGMSVPASIVGVAAIIGAGVCFVTTSLAVCNGIGLLKLRNWARILTIVLAGLGLCSAVFGILMALLHFRIFVTLREAIVAALYFWILTYLLKPHVKQAFGASGF